MSDNVIDADNQQGSSLLHIFGSDNPSETTRRAPFTKQEAKGYLQGALHDAYQASGKRIRFSQKYKEWLYILSFILKDLGYKSWIYREGKRNVYVLETTAEFLDFNFNPSKESPREQKGYIRGFFDAEGGVPHKKSNRFYIQFVQKDQPKLIRIAKILSNLGIESGKIHNPSKAIDPEYWRFYIRANSYKGFCKTINSWHPVKNKILKERVKI